MWNRADGKMEALTDSKGESMSKEERRQLLRNPCKGLGVGAAEECGSGGVPCRIAQRRQEGKAALWFPRLVQAAREGTAAQPTWMLELI